MVARTVWILTADPFEDGEIKQAQGSRVATYGGRGERWMMGKVREG